MEAEKRGDDLCMDLPNFLLKPETLEWEHSEAESANSMNFVLSFVRRLAGAIKKKDQSDLLSLYDFEFSKLTERFFTVAQWPAPSVVQAELPETSKDALNLYAELFFRYVHSRAQAALDQRKAAFDNYTDFFDTRLDYGDQDALVLPSLWAWDLIDEFTYQFQAYWQQYSSESQVPGIWMFDEVLGYLRKLIQVSSVASGGRLREPRSSQSLSRLLGYFAIVGQVRVLTQLGDYEGALGSIGFISEDGLTSFSVYPPAYVSLLHHAGFCLLMLGRYYDAERFLYRAAAFIARMKQYLTRSYQYNIIMKKSDQICALLSIAHVLTPSLPDVSVRSLLSEKLADRLIRMSTGDSLSLFEESFLFGGPKFIRIPNRSATDPLSSFREAVQRQLLGVKLFSFLRIYRRLSTAKLGKLLGVESVADLLSEIEAGRRQKTPQQGLLETEVRDLSVVKAVAEGDFVLLVEKETAEDPKKFFMEQSALLHQLLVK